MRVSMLTFVEWARPGSTRGAAISASCSLQIRLLRVSQSPVELFNSEYSNTCRGNLLPHFFRFLFVHQFRVLSINVVPLIWLSRFVDMKISRNFGFSWSTSRHAIKMKEDEGVTNEWNWLLIYWRCNLADVIAVLWNLHIARYLATFEIAFACKVERGAAEETVYSETMQITLI